MQDRLCVGTASVISRNHPVSVASLGTFRAYRKCSGGTLLLFLFIHDSICIPAACFTVSVLILLLHAWWVRTQKALPARIPLPETLCFEDICERLRAAAVEDTCRESGIPSAAAICRRRACL